MSDKNPTRDEVTMAVLGRIRALAISQLKAEDFMSSPDKRYPCACAACRAAREIIALCDGAATALAQEPPKVLTLGAH